MLVIVINDMPDSFLTFDINNRHYFKNFTKVVFCVKNYYYSSPDVLLKMSKISFNPFNYLYNFNPHYLIKLYQNYLQEINVKKTPKRLNNIEMLSKYLKGKKKVTTEEVMKHFGVSSKWVERYMFDVNQKYQNIGYEYLNKYWYIVKQR